MEVAGDYCRYDPYKYPFNVRVFNRCRYTRELLFGESEMEIAIGTKGIFHQAAGGTFPATVTNVNEDSTVDVAADDGGQLHNLPAIQQGEAAPEAVDYFEVTGE